MSPKLTLNLGLRYEINLALSTANMISNSTPCRTRDDVWARWSRGLGTRRTGHPLARTGMQASTAVWIRSRAEQ